MIFSISRRCTTVEILNVSKQVRYFAADKIIVAKEIKDSFCLFLFSNCLLRWQYAESSTVKKSTDQLPTLLSGEVKTIGGRYTTIGSEGGTPMFMWYRLLMVTSAPCNDMSMPRNIHDYKTFNASFALTAVKSFSKVQLRLRATICLC